MIRFEEVCEKENPDVVVVVGDVNSTIAAGLVAKKLHVALAHVEAGLRSRDRSMPEEINRMATDAITDLFFTTEKQGTQNLLDEGHDARSVHFVGHVMIDNLIYQMKKLDKNPPSPFVKKIKQSAGDRYICMTMHRPSNVDTKEKLESIVGAIGELAQDTPVIFPCHPRTRKNIERFGLTGYFTQIDSDGSMPPAGICITEPMGYNDFLYLWKECCLVLTDSGGMQEETTALQIPCITMRENTERPITAEIGSNVVVGSDRDKIIDLGRKALSGEWKQSAVPELWDGRASERIVKILTLSD
jgi:UDP-N-acetylglucosamine 2-epimerase (non-hydrolysing)